MIKFRPHEKKDIPFRVKWLNNKKATIFTIDNPDKKTTIAEQKEWFKNYQANVSKNFFTILDDEKPIGFMGLSNIDHNLRRASIFILIGEDNYRGEGVGTVAMKFLIERATNDLLLKELLLEVNKLNVIAIGLYKKFGFKITGEDEIYLKMTLFLS